MHIQTGKLAREAGYRLPLQVLKSNAGFYIGTSNETGPVSRESVEYYALQSVAEEALGRNEWTQRVAP